MFDDIWGQVREQLLIFVSFIGAIGAGLLGLVTKHTDQDEGINWGRVWRGTPIAIFSGVFAHFLGYIFEWPLEVIIPAASAIAFIGPEVVAPLLEQWTGKFMEDLRARIFGRDRGKKNGG